MADPLPTGDAGRRSPGGGAPEPAFNLAGVVVALIGLCLAIHLVRSFILTPEQDFALVLRGAYIPLRYSGEYVLDVFAFTSPLTYSLLHGGFAHLAVNMVWLAAFGSPLAHRIGTVRFLLFWAVTSLAAVAAHTALHIDDPLPLVGASGAISGMMGAAARFGFRVDRGARPPAFAGDILPVRLALSSRTVVTFLAIWMAVNLVAGFGFLTPGSDNPIAWEAHIGGFLAGFMAIRPFDRKAPARR